MRKWSIIVIESHLENYTNHLSLSLTVPIPQSPINNGPLRLHEESKMYPNPNSHASPTSAPSHQQGAGPSGPVDPHAEKWGTHVMGSPAVPTCHPGNKKAASWAAGQPQPQPQPYVQHSPAHRPSDNPVDTIRTKFNTWGSKAENMANNVWHNLKTGSNASTDAWGKVNLAAKAISGGGFDALYKQTFMTFPEETLKKSFACYLSTTTGPVAGTMYLSNIHVAFCSDRPLSFKAPSGQESWSYYKVMVPLEKVAAINPVVLTGNPSEKEKYIQVVTLDGHDFWFMGFVSFDKASQHLSEGFAPFAVTGFPATGVPLRH